MHRYLVGRFLVFPFRFDDALAEFRHKVDGVGAIGTVDLDGIVVVEEANHIVARNGAAAA